MKYFLHTLYGKLTVAFLLLVTILGAWLLYLSHSTSERYSQEVMQRLNQSVAMYVTDQQTLINDGIVDEIGVAELASRAMILNPSLEIYIIDPAGKILSHRVPENDVLLSSVSMTPINDYLSGEANFPILGEDPRTPGETNAFSVSPIMHNDQLQGYVYAIIGGQLYQQLKASVRESYVMKAGTLLMGSSILIAALAGCVLFFFLTRRLTKLRTNVVQFDPASPIPITHEQTLANLQSNSEGDEITQLNSAFQQMQQQIGQQFDMLKTMDETRRELISNVSHDLRTPLAALQGYIELLMIKNDSLSTEEKEDHLKVAYKHSQRLGQLISELFELSKLESSGMKPTAEPFSLLELAHDCVQEFGLSAKNKEINLSIETKENDCFVVADIALIHRVLQNLIDNAIRHTPSGGNVKISVLKADGHASIEVSDTGRGIQTHEIPHIFDRYYQSQLQQPSDELGTGLGLAIVKRILELHKSKINVVSQINKGTSFTFDLPQPQASFA